MKKIIKEVIPYSLAITSLSVVLSLMFNPTTFLTLGLLPLAGMVLFLFTWATVSLVFVVLCFIKATNSFGNNLDNNPAIKFKEVEK
ncbi:hypothetical protein [Billgrantia endophytica]|uniref:hypothetical protein n=1 Tax=Billgrantia endophytica TaxID=2033802 RepID=UPI001054D2BE|nr:hypothetical protein [Halomonas endophytica]